MRSSHFLTAVLVCVLSISDLSGQHFFVSASMANPKAPDVFKVSYSSGTAIEAGVTGFSSNRFFFQIGVGYLSVPYDENRLFRVVDNDVRILKVTGGDISYLGLNAGVGALLMPNRTRVNPFIRATASFGAYTEEALVTTPSSEFEQIPASENSLMTGLELGIHTWIVQDKFAFSFAYSYSYLHVENGQPARSFDAYKVQMTFR